MRYSPLFGVWVFLYCGFAAFPSQASPNILLIYVDDLGYGDLGSFGHPVIKTPSLDQLAEEGLSLRNYYASSGLCSPSRAALLTGRLPYRTGIKSWIPEASGVFLKTSEITLAELLLEQNYQTALVGKWHLNSSLENKKEPQPKDHGFQHAFGHNAFQIPTNKNPTNLYRNGKHVQNVEGYTADLFADEAISWLEKRNPKQPFFLFFSMAEPHTTIENPAEYNAMYADYTQGEVVPIPSGEVEPPKHKLIPRGPGEYYANVTYMDHQIGRVLSALDDLDLTENTVVIFTSDNGPVTSNWINWWEVNAYGSTGGLRGRKHLLYEGGIKVPAIVRFPGVTRPGSETNELVVGTDWFVTLANMVGAEVPTDRMIDGIDVSGVFLGQSLEERTLFWSLDAVSNLEHVVRRGRWKLFLDREGNPQELYDLQSDPLEFFNVVTERKKIRQDLRQAFDAYYSSISDGH
ncbi:MAG: sulfatase-like hydrolase/transferase [Pseudomonadota bacterium]